MARNVKLSSPTTWSPLPCKDKRTRFKAKFEEEEEDDDSEGRKRERKAESNIAKSLLWNSWVAPPPGRLMEHSKLSPNPLCVWVRKLLILTTQASKADRRLQFPFFDFMVEIDVVEIPVIGYRQAVTLESLLLTELTWTERRLDCACDCDVVVMTPIQSNKRKRIDCDDEFILSSVTVLPYSLLNVCLRWLRLKSFWRVKVERICWSFRAGKNRNFLKRLEDDPFQPPHCYFLQISFFSLEDNNKASCRRKFVVSEFLWYKQLHTSTTEHSL